MNHRPLLTTVLLSIAAISPLSADRLLERMPAVFERAAGQTRLLLESINDDKGLPHSFNANKGLVTVGPTG